MPTTQNQWLDQVQSVLEILNQGVIITDDQRQIVFANTMFLEMIKKPAKEVCGRLITDLYPPEELAESKNSSRVARSRDALYTNSTCPKPMAGDCPSLSHPARCTTTTADSTESSPLPTSVNRSVPKWN